MFTMAFFIFANMEFICFNGDLIEKHKPVLFADNRSFKYGDGVFETILFLNGKIILEDYHFERLFNSLQFLQIKFPLFFHDVVKNNFLSLCKQNKLDTCRIRLTVYREEDNNASYIIETTEVPITVPEFNKEGWRIELYPYARKSIDAFSNLKSVCYQQFVMADKYAKDNSFNESIVLNTNNHICEGSKTNIFLFRNQQVFTPALHEGCVNGVMRRHVIEEIKKMGIPVKQTAIKEEDIFNAEEVFLTNSIQVIKWVKTYKEINFSSSFSKELSKKIFNNF